MTEQEYWDEDADRINALCRAARRAGITVGTVPEPPELNPDGSLAGVELEPETDEVDGVSPGGDEEDWEPVG